VKQIIFKLLKEIDTFLPFYIYYEPFFVLVFSRLPADVAKSVRVRDGC